MKNTSSREHAEPLSLAQIFGHPEDVTEREYLNSILEGEGPWGYFLVKVLILLVGLSTLSFSLDSVEALHDDYHTVFLGIDLFCLSFFTLEYFLRIMLAQQRLKYALKLMSLIDLLSILPSWLNILYAPSIPRLQFFRILRLFKFLISTRKGRKSAIAFQQSWQENSSLLLASTYLFVSVWIIFSCLQYLAEFDNEEMLHCVPPHSHSTSTTAESSVSSSSSSSSSDNGVDCSCDSNTCSGQDCVCVARYGSLLSSMYFTLIEFSGTFQLAKSHSTFGRFIAVGTVIASVGIFAVPTSLFAAALSQAARVIHSENNDSDDEDSDGEGTIEDSFSRINDTDHSIQVIALQVSSSHGVYTARKYPAYTLTPTYKLFSTVLIGLSAICAIASTMPFYSHWPFVAAGFHVVDVVCIVTFGMEHVCRVAAEGPQNTTAQLCRTFLPTADTLAWLPSLLVYLSGGGIPPPIIALSVAFFRILKLERYSNGFWILHRVMKRSWSLLSVGGMATFCILMFTSTLLFYTEKNNPDPNVRKYYTSVPKAFWTTTINIAGMAEVDYSHTGRVIAGVLCLLTIAVFAVPIGAIGGGFQEVMNAMVKQEKMLADMMKRKKEEEERPARRSLRQPSVNKNYRRYGSTTDIVMNETKSADLVPPVCKISRHSIRRHSCDTAAAEYDAIPSAEKDEDEEEDVDPHSPLNIDHAWGTEIKRLRKVVKGQVEGNWFMGLSIFMTLMGVGVEIVSTCEGLQRSELWQLLETYIELLVIIWFTIEIIYRTLAFGRDYITSKLGILDLIATVPWYIAQGLLGSRIGRVVDRYDGPLRFIKLMRLMRLDAYSPSISLIGDAIDNCWDGLKVAVYSFVVLWYFFNAWLYLSQHRSGEIERNSTPYHFRTALSALQYSGMLLTNGYGDMDDLSLSGQLCCGMAVMVAVGIAAVPASVLANSFVTLLRVEAEKDLSMKVKVALVTQRVFRRRRSGHDFAAAVRLATTAKRNSSYSMQMYRHLMGVDEASWYPCMNISLIICNVVVVMLESVNHINACLPPLVWSSFELMSVHLFTLDYICVLYTIQYNLDNKCSRITYIFSLRGLCALCSILPFWTRLGIKFYFGHIAVLTTPRMVVAFRILRVFRIIGLDRYIKCYYYLNAVLTKVSSVLTAAGIVALIVWVGLASMFYYAELPGKREDGNGIAVFESIPESLYFCALFLVGDWQIQDFSPLGAVLCVLLSLFGVAIFALPVGVLFEGFKTAIVEQKNAPPPPVRDSAC